MTIVFRVDPAARFDSSGKNGFATAQREQRDGEEVSEKICGPLSEVSRERESVQEATEGMRVLQRGRRKTFGRGIWYKGAVKKKKNGRGTQKRNERGCRSERSRQSIWRERREKRETERGMREVERWEGREMVLRDPKVTTDRGWVNEQEEKDDRTTRTRTEG